MNAHLKDFTGCRAKKRTAADPYDAELLCTFEYQGKDYPCKASVRRHIGTLPDSKHIEIGQVQGLPASAKYDHDEFAASARKYDAEKVLEKGD